MQIRAKEAKSTRGPRGARELVVECPERGERVPISVCARCVLCDGLELDASCGGVSVRCIVEPEDAEGAFDELGATVERYMASPVITVHEAAALENVRWLVLDRVVGAVPVVDAEELPVGLLTTADLLRAFDETTTEAVPPPTGTLEHGLAERVTSELCARDAMTPVAHAVSLGSPMGRAAWVMARERVHHVLVLGHGGTVVGLVSSLDVARWAAACARPSR